MLPGEFSEGLCRQFYKIRESKVLQSMTAAPNSGFVPDSRREFLFWHVPSLTGAYS
jgi:hypothetical protein